MPQEKRTFQTERTRNELKEKKKIEYMDLDERIKQRLKEPNEIPNNNLLSSKASSTVYKLCGRRIAPKVVITMSKNRRDGERNWWTWKKYARGLLDYLIPDNMPDIIAAKYRDGGELPMMDKIPPFYKVKVKHGMRNGKMQNPIRIVQDQDS